MSSETLTAVASVATTVVIAATAIAAMIQLRHMRAANSIQAILSFREMLEDDVHRDAANLLRSGDMARALEEPAFRQYLYRMANKLPSPPADERYLRLHQASIAIGNSFELIGGMVRNQVVTPEIFLPNYWWVVSNHWGNLESFIAMMREYQDSPGLYVDFEYLTVLSRQWGDKHPDSYAPGVPRIEVKNKYPLSEQSWAKE